MTKKITSLLLLAVFALTFTNVKAQDEKSSAILEKLSTKMKSIPSFSADFKSMLVDKQADMEQSQSGSIKVSGEKFELSLGDHTVLSDGNSVWTYNTASNEVMIDNLDEMFEDDISPTKLYTIWEEGFKHSFAGEEEIDKVNCTVIKLFPNDPSEKNYHTIMLYVDENAMVIKRATILGKEGTDISYTISNFQKQGYAASEFHFEKSKHPGVEVIDNR